MQFSIAMIGAISMICSPMLALGSQLFPNNSQVPAQLPACGHFCTTLILQNVDCGITDAACICKNSQFFTQYTDCIVNGGHCTTKEEELEAFGFYRSLCNNNKVQLPKDPVEHFNITRTKAMTTRQPNYLPTTYQWEFTYTTTVYEVETTYGPCPTVTASIQKRQEEPETTITTTTTVVVTITQTITIDLPYPTVSEKPEWNNHSTTVQTLSTSGLCPLVTTKTILKPIVSTYVSTQTASVNATDTRGPRPTSSIDFGNGTTGGASGDIKSKGTGFIYLCSLLVLIAFAMQY